jgi:hypothetical protein
MWSADSFSARTCIHFKFLRIYSALDLKAPGHFLAQIADDSKDFVGFIVLLVG